MGNLAFFVGTDHKVYLTDLTNNNPTTNTKQLPLLTTELGADVQWHKIAVSKDLTKFALLSYPYEPRLIIYDRLLDKFQEFEISSPSSQSEPEFLDMIHFDPTGQFVIYDAYHTDSEDKGFWDIGIIRIWDNAARSFGDGQIFRALSPPSDGYSYGNPVFSNLSTDLIAFPAFPLMMIMLLM